MKIGSTRKEDIQIIFTDSQFKLAKLYKSHQEFKDAYKKYGCQFVIAQFDEDWPPDKTMNYQFLQSLESFTDEEIEQFVAKTHDKIMNLANSPSAMLVTLKANENSFQKDKVALALYPELLRDGYERMQLKDIKKRMVLDAKSGAIKCKNKRLYVLPDFYAACEKWFCGIENPKGLLEKDEVACKLFRNCEKVDILRSPSLYMEHAPRKVTKDKNIYKWLCSDGIYTSVKDLISRILQFDVDGDQLNVIGDPLIVDIAERNIQMYDIIPLFYDAAKAPAEEISKVSIFNGLKRAHQFSNIGEISNMLTRLWNRDKPDRHAAALLTALNNWRIDFVMHGRLAK